ncbi:hypothetical protein QWJ26_24690 [Streptomyces sp. CSDS2]|uniref:DUF7919 family protein n=1 Tax=Streptomyces sp. CSDS2 TaxID=3055051 RepID=UPI0025B142E2|nr:hypothetical protein [Streptomyces sp. CSDS2]MDN3262947.1 hypothetical protein [Streptomyces sp. CSDS2]
MAYYPDLSPYSYESGERDMLNVGWLSREHAYTTGVTPEGLVEALAGLARHAVNVQRGMHFRDLCPDFHTARERTSREDLFLGSGEIHVPNGRGLTYASPAMIVHYVEDHSYLPPEDYRKAVRDRWGALRGHPGYSAGTSRTPP